jgi:hypothetical protein
MVGVLGLAILGVVAFVTLRLTRRFLLNLERAKKMGLPYVIGRKFSSLVLEGEVLRCHFGWLAQRRSVASD